MGVIRRSTASLLVLSLYLLQMLSISAAAPAVAKAPVPALAPAVSPVAPATSPPAPPTPAVTPPPAEPPTPVVKTFPINHTLALSAGNGTDPSRQIAVALTSPNKTYALALVMDGFGKVGDTREFCWVEIYKVGNQSNLTFRENCNPRRVEDCSLSLTDDGDLRLTLESSGGKLVSWKSNTEGDDVTEAKLDDQGLLTLVKLDGTVVWSSAADASASKCRGPFSPPPESSGALLRLSKLLLTLSTLVGLMISSHL